MIRGLELALFLLPFLLFGAWWFLGRTATRQVMWAACTAVLLIGASLAWYGLTHRIGINEIYVPAHIENGQVVPGHGVPAPP